MVKRRNLNLASRCLLSTAFAFVLVISTSQAAQPRILVNGKRVQPLTSPHHVDTVQARIQKIIALERAAAENYRLRELAAKRLAEAPHAGAVATVRNLLAWACEPLSSRLAMATDQLDPTIRGALDMSSLSGLALAYDTFRRTQIWVNEIDPELHAAMAMPTWQDVLRPAPEMSLPPAPAINFTAALPKPTPEPAPIDRLNPALGSARIVVTTLMPLDFENNVLFSDITETRVPAIEEVLVAEAAEAPVKESIAAPANEPVLRAEVIDAVEVIAFDTTDPAAEPSPEFAELTPGPQPESDNLLREVAMAATKSNDKPKNPLADIAAPSNALHDADVSSMTLASVARQRGFLDEAWVSYDKDTQVWEAKWPKPPMFHYGSILMPVLASRMDKGQSVDFEIDGRPARITKREDGKLVMARGGDARLVGARDIKGLLQNKIKSDGMILFLDPSGNLVLQATGNQAVAMAGLSPNAM